MNRIKQLTNFDTAEVSDALDSLGIESVLLGLKPINPGQKLYGPVYTVQYEAFDQKPDNFQSAGNYMDEVPEGAVILIDNAGREDCTCWGDILTRVAQRRKIQGTLIHGACRDVSLIRTLNYPVFSKAVTMRSGKNRVYKAASQCIIRIGLVKITPGDIAFADDNGALIIPQALLAEVITRAQRIKDTEVQIVTSIEQGESLEETRKQHRYDMPWLSEKEKSAC